MLNDIKNNNVNYGDIICSQPNTLDKLYNLIDKINQKVNIRLIDHNTNSLCKSFFNFNNILNHKNIINIYSENWMDKIDNPKIKIEPIGISYKDIYIKDIYNDLESISKSMPNNNSKPIKVLCNAHKMKYDKPKSGYRNDRSIMMKYLKDKTDIIDFCDEKHDFSKKQIINTWKKHKDYAFELSPSGNGLDCHRTYEALILKTIPIVRTNTLDPIYLEHDLPVVIVKEWNEVTKENLEKWHEKYKNYFTDELDDKMRTNYWNDKII